MEILMTEHFIREPVEHVEEQEAEWKDGSGDCVDAFGPLDETPADFEECVSRGQVYIHGRRL